MIASFAQMCLLDGIVSQVRDVAHGPRYLEFVCCFVVVMKMI